MKVIQRNSDSEWPKEIVCPHCACTIEYDERDLEDLDHGIGFQCPDCGKEIYVEEFELHKFPDAFFNFDGPNTVHLSDEETQKYIDWVVEHLKGAEVGDHVSTGTGDTLIIGIHYEDQDTIYVMKNYWEENYNFR